MANDDKIIIMKSIFTFLELLTPRHFDKKELMAPFLSLKHSPSEDSVILPGTYHQNLLLAPCWGVHRMFHGRNKEYVDSKISARIFLVSSQNLPREKNIMIFFLPWNNLRRYQKASSGIFIFHILYFSRGTIWEDTRKILRRTIGTFFENLARTF